MVMLKRRKNSWMLGMICLLGSGAVCMGGGGWVPLCHHCCVPQQALRAGSALLSHV